MEGFFDLIGRADLYVVLDGAQYVKRHWHNRNRTMTPNGAIWLTIPVATKSRFEQPIDEVTFAQPWAEKHWASIEMAYRKSPYYQQEAPALKTLYEAAAQMQRLTDVNTLFLQALMKRLDISAIRIFVWDGFFVDEIVSDEPIGVVSRHAYVARSKSVRRSGSYGFGGLTNVRLIDWGDILKSRSVHDKKSAG
jgi:hypothetical protein